jgi:hypothetical protein
MGKPQIIRLNELSDRQLGQMFFMSPKVHSRTDKGFSAPLAGTKTAIQAQMPKDRQFLNLSNEGI